MTRHTIADPAPPCEWLPRGAISLAHLAPMPAGEPTWSLATHCADCGYRLVRTGEGRPPVVVRCEACGELWEVRT